MESKLLENICVKYKLSTEEHKRIGNYINEFMLSGKKTEANPVAIIDIAPPGSGKTGLNGMAVEQFEKNNVIVINSDELKPFHPQIIEIAKKYPQYYTKVTNQESNSWTDQLFEKAVDGNYNIIFEGTGRNLQLLKKMIEKMSKYKIVVRGMAVNELNCLMSILERYEEQIKEKGWGRLVTLPHFYKAYEEMLDTVDHIENFGIVDEVEVYIRGNKPTNPVKIYSSVTREFYNAKSAVVKGRENDLEKANEYFKSEFSKNQSKYSKTKEQNELLYKIKENLK